MDLAPMTGGWPLATLTEVAPFMVLWAVKATAVLGAALLMCMLLRRRSSAARHSVWYAALATILLLPVLTHVLPSWQISDTAPIPLPSWASADQMIGTERVSVANGDHAASIDPMPARQRAGAAGVALLWLLGSCVVLAWVVVGRFSAARAVRRATSVEFAEWNAIRDEGVRLLGIRAEVPLRMSRDRVMPAVVGLAKPVLLLPGAADGWPLQAKRAAMIHELAHVRRGDATGQLVAHLACMLLWPHPGVWLAARQLRIERERACDDLVISAGILPSAYAQFLMGCARALRLPRLAHAGGLALARPTQLEGRLLAILDAGRDRRPAGMTARSMAVLLALFAVPLSAAATRKPAPDGSAPSLPISIPSAPSAPSADAAEPQGATDVVSTLAEMVTASGAWKLVLTREAVLFMYTEDGAEAMARRASAAARAAGEDADATYLDARERVGDMQMRFPTSGIRTMELAGASLRILMTSRPADAAEDDPRGLFAVPAPDREAARAFVTAFEELRRAPR